MLTAFYSIGENKGSPRLFVETNRLNQLGMQYGTPLLSSLSASGRELTLEAAVLGDRHVSRRRALGGFRPIIDINSRALLNTLSDYGEVRVRGTFNRLVVTPSIRATHVHTQRRASPVFPILEVFAGGGFMGEAFTSQAEFAPAAAVEIEPDYADEYILRNPHTELFLGDIRKIHPDEYPPFSGLLAGIPCVDHAQSGRAKKRLKGCAELGDAGALFLPVLDIIAHRYPLFAVFENVPSFGRSLAGRMLLRYLSDLGYETTSFVMQPNSGWNEPTSRNRWIAIATLQPGFCLRVPNTPFTGAIREFLDAPDAARDRADAERIARSLESLRRHNARHQSLGHRFRMTVLNGDETVCPTITRSYYKFNSSGAYVQTPWGPRPLRKSEIERLHGHRIHTEHYSTAVQLSGQAVLTRPFVEIARQLASHLSGTALRHAA